MTPLKKTPFHHIHRNLGGKLVEFGGYEMPVQYTGILDEHMKVREAVGVFDVSHMGEVDIRGRDAKDFVQRITVNDVDRLSEGKVQYSAMCYLDGGIVDDLLVYHMGDHYFLVINASNISKDISWMKENMVGDVSIVDRSDETALVAVQGPKSLATLQKLTNVSLSGLEYYTWTHGSVAGVPMIISRTGYTGEVGFELYFRADDGTATSVWNAVMDSGREHGIAPCGLGARDTLRLEMGFCLYGNDIDRSTNPLEAGLQWLTKLDKGAFNGSESLAAVKKQGLHRKLVGFVLEDKAFPRHGYEIAANGQRIGHVTSGTFSPVLQKGIGMGYVGIGHAAPGTRIEIAIRNRMMQAAVVKLPFIRK